MMENWRKGPISDGYHGGSCWVPVAATCGVCRAGPSLGAHIHCYTGKLWYDGKMAKRDLLGYLAVELHSLVPVATKGF